MNSEGRQTGAFGDELTNAAMIGLVALFGAALVLRAAGTITAWLTGTAQPKADSRPGSACWFIPATLAPRSTRTA